MDDRFIHECSWQRNTRFLLDEKVGAMSYPVQQAVYNVTDYGAKGDALSMNTMAIQKQLMLQNKPEAEL